MVVPQSSNALSKVRCICEGLSRVPTPAGLSEEDKTYLINKIAIMKDRAIFEEGKLVDFIGELSKITEAQSAILRDLFNTLLVHGHGQQSFEEGIHYRLGQRGYIRADPDTSRNVILTPAGKSRLFWIAINEGFQQNNALATAYVDYQAYLVNLLDFKEDSRENTDTYFRNKKDERAAGKQLFHRATAHLMENHDLSETTAKRKLQVNQKKHYNALCPDTKGAHSAAVLRANGEDPDDMIKRKKIERKSVSSHLTVFGNAENNQIHGKALSMSMRHPDMDYNECVSIVTKACEASGACRHLEPNGDFVSAEEQERIMYNDAAWV